VLAVWCSGWKYQDFNNYPFFNLQLHYSHNINRSYNLNCSGVIVTELTKFVCFVFLE